VPDNSRAVNSQVYETTLTVYLQRIMVREVRGPHGISAGEFNGGGNPSIPSRGE